MATYRDIHTAALNSWARIDLVDEGSYRLYPIQTCSVSYGLNSIPAATFILPYGFDTLDDNWFDSTYRDMPSGRYSHRVRIYTRINGEIPAKLIFDGYLTSLSHIRAAQGRIRTLFTAQGWLGLLSQQFTSILRGESPMVYSGDPWFSNVMGISWGTFEQRIARENESISDVVIEMLLEICNYQETWGVDFQSGTIGAAAAASALNAYKPCGSVASLQMALDQYTKDSIAYAIGKAIHANAGDLWNALVRFATTFHFVVVPRVSDFLLVPFVRPGYDRPRYGTNHVYYDEGDVSSITLDHRGLNPNPIRSGVVVSEHVGYWGFETEQEVLAGYDLSSIYPETDPRQGAVLRIPAPEWFPPYDSGIDIAEKYCKQHVLDQIFIPMEAKIVLPYLSCIAPGSLVEVRTRSTYPTLGASNLMGVAATVTLSYESGDSPSVQTHIGMIYAVDIPTFEAISFSSHLFTQQYYLWYNLSDDLGPSYGKR